MSGSLVAQTVNNLPAMQKTWVRSLGWEDLLEEGRQSTAVFLPGESPWTEEPDGIEPKKDFWNIIKCKTLSHKISRIEQLLDIGLGHNFHIEHQT